MEPYTSRIVEAYSQVEVMGLVNYWRNLFASILAAGDLDELKKEWEYCYRVSDHSNPLFSDLERIKNQKKQALQGV